MRITSFRRVEPPRASAQPMTAAVAPSPAQVADTRIGTLLVAAGALTPIQAEQVARSQAASGERFGESAMGLGFVDRAAIERALARQFDFSVAHPAETRLHASLVVATGGQDRNSELIRNLRAKLAMELAGHGDAPRHVVVASISNKVGRRVIAANLAIAFAQSGVRTLLVDADLRRPTLHKLFDAPNQTGLSGFLAGRQPRPTIIPIDEIENLAVHPAGPVPPNPGELLSRLGKVLAELRDSWGAELVLFNTPPLDTTDDAHLVAAAAGGVLIITRRNFTRLKPLAAAHKRFAADGARIVGSVINVA